jgi:hypothetical protein
MADTQNCVARTAEQQNGRTAERQNGTTAERQNGRKAGRQNGRTAQRQNSRTAERQNGRTAERQNGRTAERQKAPQVKFRILICYTIGPGKYREFLERLTLHTVKRDSKDMENVI